jgi:hypothetical protein
MPPKLKTQVLKKQKKISSTPLPKKQIIIKEIKVVETIPKEIILTPVKKLEPRIEIPIPKEFTNINIHLFLIFDESELFNLWNKDETYKLHLLEFEKIKPGYVNLFLNICSMNLKLHNTKLLKQIFNYSGWTKDILKNEDYFKHPKENMIRSGDTFLINLCQNDLRFQ